MPSYVLYLGAAPVSGVVVQDMGLLVDRGVSGQGLWVHSLEYSGPIARYLSNIAETASRVSAAWTTANLAYVIGFTAGLNIAINRAWWYNGGVVAGNVDVGIYDQAGLRVASTGAVAQSGTNALQSAALTLAVTLRAGQGYYLAMSASDATAEMFAVDAAGAFVAAAGGWCQVASAHPLPTSITLATTTNRYLRVFGVTNRTTV